MGTRTFFTAKFAFESNKSTSYHYNRWRKRKKHMIILDWDDTLMCTSSLIATNFNPNQKEKEKIEQLGSLSDHFLSLCRKNGDVFLVTNSASQWLYSSVNLYFPNKKDILNDIVIYSNRDKYQNYPPSQWKEKAFADIDPYIRQCSNILCIGDSEPDVDEGKKIQKKYLDINVTTIKLKKEPTIDIMITQIKYLITSFSLLFKYPVHIDLQNEKGIDTLIAQ